MKRIGILAGMGPRTTSPFLELVLDEAQKHGAVQDGAQLSLLPVRILAFALMIPIIRITFFFSIQVRF